MLPVLSIFRMRYVDYMKADDVRGGRKNSLMAKANNKNRTLIHKFKQFAWICLCVNIFLEMSHLDRARFDAQIGEKKKCILAHTVTKIA